MRPRRQLDARHLLLTFPALATLITRGRSRQASDSRLVGRYRDASSWDSALERESETHGPASGSRGRFDDTERFFSDDPRVRTDVVENG